MSASLTFEQVFALPESQIQDILRQSGYPSSNFFD